MACSPIAAVLLVATLIAGCASPSDNAAPSTSEAVSVSPAPTPVVSIDLAGTILLRAPGTGSLTFAGNASAFCFSLPEGSTRLAGHLSWSPSEPMGLEFHHGPAVITSWTTFAQNVTSPIDLNVESSGPGSWFAYAGPGVVGAAVSWTLNLTVTGSPGSTAWDRNIRPDGNVLEGQACR